MQHGGVSANRAVTAGLNHAGLHRSLARPRTSNATGIGCGLQFIRPGKPVDNAHIESFNGRLREECLNQHMFRNLNEAIWIVEMWRQDYNHARPRSALGYLAPAEFRENHQPKWANSASLSLAEVAREN